MKVKYTIEVYKDKKKEYRWRIKRQGRIVADSGESYKRKSTMMKTVEHLISAIKKNEFWMPE